MMMMMMIIIIITFRVNWRYSIEDWVIASLLKSLKLFWVFKPILTMLLSWMVLIRPLISKSSRILPSSPITNGITVTLLFHGCLSSLLQLFASHFFFVNYHNGLVFWPGLICISENCMLLIIQDWFWIVHVPISSMVKLQFFVQFPMDHLPHPIMSNFTLPLH